MPIKLYSEGSSYFTQALSKDGEPWLTLSVPMNGSAVTETKSVDLYTSLGGGALISKSTWDGTFVERRSLKSFFFKNTLPDREYISLGEGFRADFLSQSVH